MSEDIFQGIENLSADDLVRLTKRANEVLAVKRKDRIKDISDLIKQYSAKPNELFGPAEIREAAAALKNVAKPPKNDDDVQLPDSLETVVYSVPNMKNVYWWDGKRGNKGHIAVERAIKDAKDKGEVYQPLSSEEKRKIFAEYKPSLLPQE